MGQQSALDDPPRLTSSPPMRRVLPIPIGSAGVICLDPPYSATAKSDSSHAAELRTKLNRGSRRLRPDALRRERRHPGNAFLVPRNRGGSREIRQIDRDTPRAVWPGYFRRRECQLPGGLSVTEVRL